MLSSCPHLESTLTSQLVRLAHLVMMRSLLVTAFALSADALDFVAVSPGTGAAYEGSLSGNGNSVGYTAANGDQWNAFIYNSSYDQSTIMITPAQVIFTPRIRPQRRVLVQERVSLAPRRCPRRCPSRSASTTPETGRATT